MKKPDPAFLQQWIEELSTTERMGAGVLRFILERNTPSPDDLEPR